MDPKNQVSPVTSAYTPYSVMIPMFPLKNVSIPKRSLLLFVSGQTGTYEIRVAVVDSTCDLDCRSHLLCIHRIHRAVASVSADLRTTGVIMVHIKQKRNRGSTDYC